MAAIQLSVIIVSYNVKHFLEYCLYSLNESAENILHEVIIIDNASTDGTIEALEKKFPEIIWLKNEVNKGFGSACNQGVNIARGEYMLFLNPDTLVTPDAIIKSLSFIQEGNKGIVGVRMIDGNGKFLAESKRANPSALSALFKLSGISQIFPRSEFFNHYAMGHINETAVVPADILCGAFMLAKTSLIKMLNGFDEQFFMYGEDVDLCFRMKKAGFQNYYYGEVTIIHFKGKSTKQKDAVYHQYFYTAMILFIKKNYKTPVIYLKFARAVIFLFQTFSLKSKGKKIKQENTSPLTNPDPKLHLPHLP